MNWSLLGVHMLIGLSFLLKKLMMVVSVRFYN